MNHTTPIVETICVGMPRTGGDPQSTDIATGPWTTGIFKEPIEGPLVLDTLGLAGDGHADLENHGGADKALCAYSASHYASWKDVLSRDAASTLAHGGFGENLTIAGLDEDGVCIGDVWRVGTAEVQVSQPRQPCWKLARKWGIPSLAERVVANGRTGWYFRVLVRGTIAAGQPMTLVRRVHPEWTVRAANDVMHRREGDTAALVELPELAASWRHTLGRRLRR